ncbi:MAG: phage holin family protein [Vulcanimicrobiota bacterium]
MNVVEERPMVGNGATIKNTVHRLTHGFSELARQEVELAKVELRETAHEVARDSSLAATGLGLALVGLMSLVAAAILALSLLMPAWAAALIMGVVVLAIAGIVSKLGVDKLKNADLAPQTLQSMQENKRWLKETIS